MSPIYEFMCSHCDGREERLLTIERRDHGPICCSTPMLRVWTSPAIAIWNQDRKFPNVNKSSSDDGSMSFQSKSDYELHLKENHLVEVSQGGVVERPHGNRVVATDGKSTEGEPARRARPGPIRERAASTGRSDAKQQRSNRVGRR